ncbi:MAG: helix-turn-helix transcriptional regulator [Rhodospirillaceae bacterium]|nr:helix-turn-helix transcriptional regulator [Rhodospirillaceae bacterium]
MQKLDAYLTQNNITSGEFAKRAGVDRAYIVRLRRGVGNPTKAVMEQIIAASDGKITPDDLFGGSSEPIEAA